MAEKHLRSEFQASRFLNSSSFSPLVDKVWGRTLVASFAILTLSDWDLRGFASSTCPVAGLLVVYIAFIPRTTEESHFLPQINIERAIVPLSLRILIILVLAFSAQTIAFGLPDDVTMPALSLGLIKAFSWYFTIRTVRSPLSPSRNLKNTYQISRLDTLLGWLQLR